MSDEEYSIAMNNAEASVCMEGYKVTPRMREQCRRVLEGEVSTGDVLRQLVADKAKR